MQRNVKKYTLACLALNNYLRLTDNATCCPIKFVDSFDSSGKLKQGEWRALNIDNRGLFPISRFKGLRYREDGIGMRNALIEYVNSKEGSVRKSYTKKKKNIVIKQFI